MKITFEKAQEIAERLCIKYQHSAWFLGIGIEPSDTDGWWVSVRVDKNSDAKPKIAPIIEGVTVRIVRHEMARAQEK